MVLIKGTSYEPISSRIHRAAKEGNIDKVGDLIKEGIDINLKCDYEGRTALHWASLYGHIDIVNFLLEQGADVYITDNAMYTALHLAAFIPWCYEDLDKYTTVDALIQAEANLEAKDKDGNTPLILAACAKTDLSVNLLITAGANLEAKDKDGNTALHRAAWHLKPLTAKALIAAGAKKDSKNSDSKTPLDIVTVILKHLWIL